MFFTCYSVFPDSFFIGPSVTGGLVDKKHCIQSSGWQQSNVTQALRLRSSWYQRGDIVLLVILTILGHNVIPILQLQMLKPRVPVKDGSAK